MKASVVIEKLQEKCKPDDEVECIILKRDGKGTMIVLDVPEKKTANEMKNLLEMFNGI